MSDNYTAKDIVGAIAHASAVLSERKEEVNRLNVFPVPDGDTGTNMSLTVKSVVDNLSKLQADATKGEIRKAITNGALMGARGNSGVITSQIFRGLCEGADKCETLDVDAIDIVLESAVDTAFHAVRKPVEGTILTVLRDTSLAARKARKKRMELNEALTFIVGESYASVQSTPELLPVLKENGVVDAGGYGLAILFDAFAAFLLGSDRTMGDDLNIGAGVAPKVEIEHIHDWEGSEYRYCNEFLVDSDTLDREEALDFLATMGDCELCVGSNPKFKVHVHSNHPDQVLAYFLQHGQVSEVFIHNMDLQAAERTEKLIEEKGERKLLGFVAVAAGEGNAKILESLGVDCVVSGGQTMNPSTKDLLDAVNAVNADAVIIMPNNKNIVMAAQSCVEVSEIPCAVVPTLSVPHAFSAMMEVDPGASLEENVEAMSSVLAGVHVGEVTMAVRDAKDAHGNTINNGDVIGIADDSIEAIGTSVEDVTMELLAFLEAADADTCTLLAGADMDQKRFEALLERIEETYDDLELDAHRGEQPLYPIVLSIE